MSNPDITEAEKYADPFRPKRMGGCSLERVEARLRIALDGHPDSLLWGEHGLIAATMRAARSAVNPFPLATEAHRKRGWNLRALEIAEIASAVGRNTGLPVNTETLEHVILEMAERGFVRTEEEKP